MELFKWNSAYSVNVVSIDKDHQVIFGLLNELYNAVAAGKGGTAVHDVVKSLVKYAQRHFRREELLMEQAGYPYLKNHIALHEYFEQSVFKYAKQLTENSEGITIEVLSFMRDWLIQHIQGVDMDFVPYLKSKNID
ncbi:MAG: bacteriohemerythrin [Bacteroidales bacterium]|nr:bacteriohemerythrin [Tenuifilaceae bacterium]